MITAQEANTIANEVNGYEKYVAYYQLQVDGTIREVAAKGKRDCIIHIEAEENSIQVANILGAILIQNGYSVRLFGSGKKYGLWIFW